MDHKLRNAITDYKGTHKLYNPYLLDCYTALMPSSHSKISMIIFNGILANKQYYKESSSFFSESEDKRIYNSQPLSLDFILSQCDPSKYERDKEARQHDIGNLVRRLKVLDEKNIFYSWRAGFPHVYMFFMERDIGVWQEFNPKGVVVPKTISKIIKQYKHCIESMLKMLTLNGQSVDPKNIANSFCQFVNRLINKTHPDVKAKLTQWDGLQEIDDFVQSLTSQIAPLQQFEGLEEDKDFQNNLPLSVKWALYPKEAPKINKKLNENTKAFVKENENIVKEKQERKTKSDDPFENLEPVPAKPVSFEPVDPFKNCNEFIKYYKDIMLLKNPSIKLPPSWTERATAIDILDMLISNNKNTVHFLKSWIGYFYSTKFQGGATSPDKVALSKLKATYFDFVKIYSEKVNS